MDQKFYTVSELTRNIKKSLEGNPEFSSIWVMGEISNLTLHSSGHIYFTLKDQNAVLSAVFFRYANRRLTFRLEEGMSVFVLGGITLFEKRGSYQINVMEVRLEGVGELQLKIEELKKTLMQEGLFDPARKKPIPFLPRRIGIVTSPTGAAVRDIIKVALRRFPQMELVLAPAKVQGDGAADTIVRGIEELNRPDLGIDVIIAGRGGGSFEDLMPFNEEQVVRAFACSRVPIISAVGHQIDHPLSDEAADLAAPTPSAAAELAVPVKDELLSEIRYLQDRSGRALSSLLRERSLRLNNISNRPLFRDPFSMVASREYFITDLETRIISQMKDRLSSARGKLLSLPHINNVIKTILKNSTHRYTVSLNSLDQLSPLSVMKRGYSIVLDRKKQVIKRATQTRAGEKISVLMFDGTLNCAVDSIEEGSYFGKEKISKKNNDI